MTERPDPDVPGGGHADRRRREFEESRGLSGSPELPLEEDEQDENDDEDQDEGEP